MTLAPAGRVARYGLYAFLISAVLFYAIPLFIVISTSLKSMEEIRAGSIFALPQAPSLAAWGKAWSGACTGLACEGISAGFRNSVMILVPSMILSILFGAMNGYALAQWRFKGADALMAAIMIGAFIPYQVVLYPLVRLAATVGIYGSLAGIVLIHVVFGLPLMTMIFRNFYASLPTEIQRAARVDGAGFFRIFFQIMLPMSTNVLIVAVILQFTGIWNDYLLGLVFAGPNYQPMTVQLNNLVGVTKGSVEYNVNMAATLLTAIPPLLVYLISGRYFVNGVASGAVKG
ncbi:MAG: sugar ABC transporter permease [Rhodovulum sulfidophilum]|uniref:Sugar ABC transporter permease n=1 Tax=Rhodovulum sulfidophilum TaxID=35806 RepID=A0A2W5N770_RHOSU|nr:MAG: sugar ABC transporter permease [Rhodovulum sulfidophilum]